MPLLRDLRVWRNTTSKRVLEGARARCYVSDRDLSRIAVDKLLVDLHELSTWVSSLSPHA